MIPCRALWRLLVLFLLTALLFPAPANADVASVRAGQGGMLVMAPNPDVRMAAEVIDIRVHETYAEFDIVYTFQNTADREIEALMGFPEFFGDSVDSRLQAFKAFDGARPVEVKKYYEDSPMPREAWRGAAMYLFRVVFGPGEEKKVRNTYWVFTTEYKFTRSFPYVLETGATWREAIGRVDITARFDPGLVIARPALAEDDMKIQPGGYRLDREKNTLTWHFENLEPTEEHNLYIPFERAGWPSWVDPQDASSIYEPEENYDCEDYHPFNLMDGDFSTGWAEDAAGPGIGEWVEIGMKYVQGRVNRVGVFNGLHDFAEYTKHPRVKEADIVFSNGKSYRIHLEDIPRMQYFDLPPTKTDSVRLVIRDVYPAAWTMRPWAEVTVISEMEVHLAE